MWKDKARVREITKTVVQAIIIMYSLIAIGLLFVLNFKELYYYDMVKLKINETSGFSMDLIKSNYDLLMNYCNPINNGKLEFIGLRMTDDAMQHFVRVKNTMRVIIASGLIGAIYSAITIYKNYKIKNGDFFRRVVITIFIIPLLICVNIVVGWDMLFDAMHKILFRGDKWVFSWFDDEVIRILPDTYFMQCALIIVGIMFLGCIGIWIAWYRIELGGIISKKILKDGKVVNKFSIGNETFDRCFKYKLIQIGDIMGWSVKAKDGITKFSCREEFKGYPIISTRGAFKNYWYKEIDVSNMRVNNVIDASETFENCRALKVDISNWKLNKVKHLDKMFKSKYIKDIDISNIDWSNIVTATEMFKGCAAKVNNLAKISVKDMKTDEMFKMFNGKAIIKISEYSIKNISRITDIKDIKVVDKEEDADEIVKRADKLQVDRMLIFIKGED